MIWIVTRFLCNRQLIVVYLLKLRTDYSVSLCLVLLSVVSCVMFLLFHKYI